MLLFNIIFSLFNIINIVDSLLFIVNIIKIIEKLKYNVE
jgi:hypothetical protein